MLVMAPAQSLAAIFTAFFLFSTSALSFSLNPYESDTELYNLDHPSSSFFRSRTRQLYSPAIKNGAQCKLGPRNICKNVSANKGTAIMNCCKSHCRNILGDRNNCGRCGKKCGYGQLCCSGVCTNIVYNAKNCGKCKKKCLKGKKCHYGVCGYA